MKIVKTVIALICLTVASCTGVVPEPDATLATTEQPLRRGDCYGGCEAAYEWCITWCPSRSSCYQNYDACMDECEDRCTERGGCDW